ncbi:hypothetical protein ACEPPN_003181 [Leptodophora sp. 'Broadleaf-Isolate-01']
MSFRHSLRNVVIISYLLALSFLAFRLDLHIRDQASNRTSTTVGIKTYDSLTPIFDPTLSNDVNGFHFRVEKSSLVTLGLDLLKERQENQLPLTKRANSWESEPRLAQSPFEKSKLREGSSIIKFAFGSLHSLPANKSVDLTLSHLISSFKQIRLEHDRET